MWTHPLTPRPYWPLIGALLLGLCLVGSASAASRYAHPSGTGTACTKLGTEPAHRVPLRAGVR
jgi:hypothetical protein